VNETRHWINGFVDLWIVGMRSGFARGPVRGALPKVCEGDPVHFWPQENTSFDKIPGFLYREIRVCGLST